MPLKPDTETEGLHVPQKNRTRFKCDLKNQSAARRRRERSAHCTGAGEGRRPVTAPFCRKGSRGYSRSQTGAESAVPCGFGKGQALSRAMSSKNRGCKRCEVTLPSYSVSTGVLWASSVLRFEMRCGQTRSTSEDVSENHQKSGNHMACE